MLNKRFFTTRKEISSGYGAYDRHYETEVGWAEVLDREYYSHIRDELGALAVGQRAEGIYFDTVIRLADRVSDSLAARRFGIFTGHDLHTTMQECGWFELQPRLEGCDDAVLALAVGEYTDQVPMEYCIRLKDAE